MSEKILIVDDEKEIADLVALYLKNEGYEVYKCYTADEALACISREAMDLAVLDIMLPKRNGFELCSIIRETYTYPVIMLTAKDGELDKITGLSLGTDDYITKPFRPLELVARVKAQLRRYKRYNTGGKSEDLLMVSGLVINEKTHECTLDERPLILTPTEFSILSILCRKKGQVVSAEEIFHEIWGEEYYSKSNNTVTVHIRHLREKMKDSFENPKYIKTVWGCGYKIGEWIFDVLLNGFICDWIWHNLMEQQTVWVDTESGTAQIVQPYWPAIRSFIMTVAVVLIFMMGGGICLSCYLYGKRQRKKEIQKISRIIGIYMENDVKTGSLFEAEYAPVETQLISIKAKMQHHEQLIREEASKKNDLITYLAHDLKTPLTSVVGYLSLLDEVKDMPAAQREKYTHVALEKSERLEKLINEFFEITRYNLTHIVLEKETINLYYMLIQMTDEFYPILQAHGNTISVEADENLEIYADSEKLARVFNNILKNAVAYSYEKTNICVTAKRTADDFIEICFTNHGRTIPEQKLRSIFDKFFRLDESRTTNSGGAGLGLAIAREIIRLHEGEISAQSADEMTTFEVKLPCAVKDSYGKVVGE